MRREKGTLQKAQERQLLRSKTFSGTDIFYRIYPPQPLYNKGCGVRLFRPTLTGRRSASSCLIYRKRFFTPLPAPDSVEQRSQLPQGLGQALHLDARVADDQKVLVLRAGGRRRTPTGRRGGCPRTGQLGQLPVAAPVSSRTRKWSPASAPEIWARPARPLASRASSTWSRRAR